MIVRRLSCPHGYLIETKKNVPFSASPPPYYINHPSAIPPGVLAPERVFERGRPIGAGKRGHRLRQPTTGIIDIDNGAQATLNV